MEGGGSFIAWLQLGAASRDSRRGRETRSSAFIRAISISIVFVFNHLPDFMTGSPLESGPSPILPNDFDGQNVSFSGAKTFEAVLSLPVQCRGRRARSRSGGSTLHSRWTGGREGRHPGRRPVGRSVGLQAVICAPPASVAWLGLGSFISRRRARHALNSEHEKQAGSSERAERRMELVKQALLRASAITLASKYLGLISICCLLMIFTTRYSFSLRCKVRYLSL